MVRDLPTKKTPRNFGKQLSLISFSPYSKTNSVILDVSLVCFHHLLPVHMPLFYGTFPELTSYGEYDNCEVKKIPAGLEIVTF